MMKNKQDLEVRHKLGKQELSRLLALTCGNVSICKIRLLLGDEEAERHTARVRIVVDDIRETRVQLIPFWLAEHYPDEAVNFSVTPAQVSHKYDFPLGFNVNHRQYPGRPAIDSDKLISDIIAYLDSIGGFRV